MKRKRRLLIQAAADALRWARFAAFWERLAAIGLPVRPRGFVPLAQ